MDGIAIHDSSGVFLYANQSYADIFGYNQPGELLGETWELLWAPRERDRFRDEILPELWRSGRWRGETTARKKDDSPLILDLSLSRMTEGGVICVVRDITERKRAEEAYARLAWIVESSEDSIMTVDFEGIIRTWNKAAEKLHGYSAEDMIGKELATLTVPDDVQTLRTHLEAIRNGRHSLFETHRITKDGRSICLSVKLSPLRDRSGKLIGASTIARDITELKRHEEANAHLAAIIESSLDGIYSTDLEGTIKTWNNGAQRLFGYSPAEAVGQSVFILYPPDRRQEEEDFRKSLEAGTRVEHFDTIRLAKDGTPRDVSLTVSPIVDQRGKLVGVSRIARDITQRKRTEAELFASAERLRLAAEAARFGIHDYDPVSRRSVWSPELYAISGLPYGTEVTIDTIRNLNHPGDRERVTRAMDAALDPSGTGEFDQEFRIRRADTGETRWIYNRARTVFSKERQGRKAVRVVGVVVDTTERKRTEEALRVATEEVERYAESLEKMVEERTAKLHESVRSLESLLYTIAHDLRAPLRAMHGFTIALQQDYGEKLDDIGKDYAYRITKASRRMDQLINDLLSFGRLAHIELPCEKTELRPAIKRSLEDLNEAISASQAQITIAGDLPPVIANRSALEQIFHNLIANALTFVARDVTPSIEISAEKRPATVCVKVRDNGIGIDPEHHERIFEVFHRLHTEEEYGGTGVGLAMVKRLVERMDGTIGVESALGKGSCFWFELPAAK